MSDKAEKHEGDGVGVGIYGSRLGLWGRTRLFGPSSGATSAMSACLQLVQGACSFAYTEDVFDWSSVAESGNNFGYFGDGVASLFDCI